MVPLRAPAIRNWRARASASIMALVPIHLNSPPPPPTRLFTFHSAFDNFKSPSSATDFAVMLYFQQSYRYLEQELFRECLSRWLVPSVTRTSHPTVIGLLYNEAQQDAKVAQTTLTYILTVHRNEKPVPDVSAFRSQTVES